MKVSIYRDYKGGDKENEIRKRGELALGSLVGQRRQGGEGDNTKKRTGFDRCASHLFARRGINVRARACIRTLDARSIHARNAPINVNNVTEV